MSNTALTMVTLSDWVGKSLGTSQWVTVDQARINHFADCTGDHQWIHVDVERATRESPFGGPIAHGYLTLSLLADMSADIGIIPPDAVAAVNYGMDKVRFLTPVKAGVRVRNTAVLTEVTDQGGGRKLVKINNTVEIEGAPKPALVAETLAVLVGRP
ncbi:MAG: MaoC family dehydratase [Hylemonella sp.]|nr:MaoC family dehydratase [Hylemonella sp.]